MERDFHHPYEPYAIQKDFMNAIYDCLEEGKVGILESPTGTGKSLSLICGSLTWLRDFKRRKFETSLEPAEKDIDEPVWLLEHERKEKRRKAIEYRAELEKKLSKIREHEQRARQRYESGEPLRKKQRTEIEAGPKDDDANFILAEYESDDERSSKVSSSIKLSAETQALMDKLGMPTIKQDSDDSEHTDELKIFFCSRTHSQLSQFVHELQRVNMPSSIPPSTDEAMLVESIKHVTLGSRKNLCINPKVSKLGSATAINERCLELQQSSTTDELKCTFLPNRENETLVNNFRDHALAEIQDIEDFAKLGKRVGICPYYATRAAVKPSEIVTLPYPLLLQKSAREALGLSVKNHVLIIDEAHNLMDAIAGINSATISLSQLKQARAQLGFYLHKFRTRLKGKNRVYVTQLVRLIDSLTSYLDLRSSASGAAEGAIVIAELLSGKAVDQINLYKLMRYLQESKLAHKVDGYSSHLEHVQSKGEAAKASRKSSSTPVLSYVQTFLAALTNPEDEGRFFWSQMEGRDEEVGDVLLKYLLLDPTYHFRDLVEEARAIILAGGTMSPMSDYINNLLHYLPMHRIETLSCGHVIPPSNLIAMPVSNGPSGVEFDFTFERRKSERMMSELGRTILEYAKSIPDGVVVFFPSYAYLDSALSLWRRTMADSKSNTMLFDAINAQKPVFSEVKSTANRDGEATQHHASTASVLAEYAAHITSTTTASGALLLAVIGGSLSEGINFSDRLGRGIIVVGLPFPNLHSPEWKAKLEFVEGRHAAREGGGQRTGKEAAREYYENACMRAVNQSVGRAIRHKDDYASIILLDRRYLRDSIQGKLPGWIRESVGVDAAFDKGMERLKSFFEQKK